MSSSAGRSAPKSDAVSRGLQKSRQHTATPRPVKTRGCTAAASPIGRPPPSYRRRHHKVSPQGAPYTAERARDTHRCCSGGCRHAHGTSPRTRETPSVPHPGAHAVNDSSPPQHKQVTQPLNDPLSPTYTHVHSHTQHKPVSTQSELQAAGRWLHPCDPSTILHLLRLPAACPRPPPPRPSTTPAPTAGQSARRAVACRRAQSSVAPVQGCAKRRASYVVSLFPRPARPPLLVLLKPPTPVVDGWVRLDEVMAPCGGTWEPNFLYVAPEIRCAGVPHPQGMFLWAYGRTRVGRAGGAPHRGVRRAEHLCLWSLYASMAPLGPRG